METEEGAVLTIPNTQLVDSKFLNWTRSNPLRRVELLVDVAYNSDLTKVTELLRKVVANTEGVQSFPVPEILCRGLRSGSRCSSGRQSRAGGRRRPGFAAGYWKFSAKTASKSRSTSST